ncbi:DsbA family oxidoreductase [Amycolatopsis thermophila]|uniref:DsbA family dithiol-disulfide isomerase n=1 Tax=Amycolatopsis thermophila TaxID=206084 RepID=A0ABU0F2D8_9PSEU|nr:DsbA family protein [Amycolatopsis thermophila]MDQ0381563.1 putative DsbA family dithiol-disulfide isomerase [Amycolatopsis thermophila]
MSTSSVTPHAAVVEHWYDFICPFCYIAQDRNTLLRKRGVRVVERGMRIHPEIGPGGAPAGPRSGPAYDFLAHEAAAAGLPLRWTDRIPYSRTALAVAEWIEQADPGAGEAFRASVFTAYFAEGRDIEPPELLVALAQRAGVDPDRLREALATTAADEALARSEDLARARGVTGTPTWIEGDRAFSGLRSRAWFAQWADARPH